MNTLVRLDYDVIRMLAGMSEDDGPDFLSMIVAMFLGSAPTLLDNLKQGAADSDLSILQKCSHDLKSSSATLGAPRLSELCASLEAQARSGTQQGAAAMVRDIVDEFEAVQPELEALLSAQHRQYPA